MALRGLTVGSDRTLRRDGVRFRNIGLNYVNAVCNFFTATQTSTFAYTSSADQDAMLDVCDSLKVKVLRVKAFPYYPAWWTTYVNGGKTIAAATAADREAHYLKIDAFLAKCRARGIGVILNLFFRHATVSDLAGQQVRAGWLTGGSATRNFAQAITQELVTRYLNEDAVYGYEWSNEVNHKNDAPETVVNPVDGSDPWPVVNPGQGTRASYSAAGDMLNGADLSTIIAWWYGVVSAIDPNRIAITGNGPNSYSQPGGTAGISTPLLPWHSEQRRDNPTNCGSIHWYGNVGYGSNGFRGLNAILTGVRHWQKQEGRGFVLGEFGNQPWKTTAISTAGGVATFTTDSKCPAEPGDRIAMCGTGTALDHQWLTVSTVNGARSSITAPYAGSVTWSGSVKGLRYIDGGKLTRMCDDIIKSGTDVALWWMLDSDPLRPVGESINDTGNDELRAAILAANTSLGW